MKYYLHVDKYKYDELRKSMMIPTNLLCTVAFFKV